MDGRRKRAEVDLNCIFLGVIPLRWFLEFEWRARNVTSARI